LVADGAVCQIICQRAVPPTQAISITVGQGLPKLDKFEWVIQKTTELGAAAIVPLMTVRAVPQPGAAHLPAKLARWQKLAREACKQSGRATVPHVHPLTSLQTFFTAFQRSDLKLVFWEGEKTRRLRSVLEASTPVSSAAIVIGPEGGLTPEEVAQGEISGFVAVRLGERILRTETASVVAVALLQHHFGDLG
jgi:16S rRNA (uracil1498-N3)-methyltransferase